MMHRKRVRFHVAILLGLEIAFLLCKQANAASMLTNRIDRSPDSPIEIYACFAQTTDTQYNADYYIGVACSMMNRDTRVATTVRFRFTAYDAFGIRLGTYVQDAEGTYSPNVMVNLRGNRMIETSPYFSTINVYPGIKQLVISIDRVLFSDGTTYSANDPRPIASAASEPLDIDQESDLCKSYNNVESKFEEAITTCTDVATKAQAVADSHTGDDRNRALRFEVPALEIAAYTNCVAGDKGTGRDQIAALEKIDAELLKTTTDTELLDKIRLAAFRLGQLKMKCAP